MEEHTMTEEMAENLGLWHMKIKATHCYMEGYG